ncbi:cation:proton antiporter [Pleomorphomonas sp. NRK KF1]|uniref:cation:proton antiporter domain-containing protein n=1 Tax=Pleomorphomonas sp. NRK KF1 TaxID=2943000 RepID=UPI002044A07C|nr:cation:proton antiporter [Pleomorphomonas sp. NRK KF1]MCM5552361.1 cation:proton antiporter [Pleomorphomonas sp. NRK KF1]
MTNAALDLREMVVFLAATGVVLPFMHRLRISPVIGFVGIGLLLGPGGLGRVSDLVPGIEYLLITDRAGIAILSELGLVFLLFMIGLELSLDRLWAMRVRVFGLGGAQMIATAGVMFGLLLLAGLPLPAAVVVGSALSMSSTAIVMQMLTERGAVGSRLGRSALAILLFQDIAVIPILVMTQAFGSAGEQSVGLDLVLAAVKASLAVAVIMALGRLLLRHLFRMVIATGIRELFLALVLVTAIGTAVLTETIGLSLALGAFLAGLLVSETEYRHQIAVDIEPVKGLLLGVFFVSVGLGIDLDRVIAAPLLHFGALIGFLAVKMAILLVVCRVVGLPKSVMAELSLLLAGGSEFVFVVVGLATGFGLLTNEVSSLIVVVVGLSMLSAPTVGVVARHLVPRLLRNETPVPDLPPEGEDGHVVIAGYGRVGRAVGGALREAGIPIAAVDADALTVGALRNAGIAIHWGNAIHRPLLKRLGTGRAAALVVTMNDTVAAADVVRVARAEWPDLPIFARAHDAQHARLLLESGASKVVLLPLEASLQLSEAVLSAVGIPEDLAHAITSAERDRQLSALLPPAGR